MITIKIMNTKKLVEREKGRLISKLAPLFIDIQQEVEKRVVEELEKVFQDKEIEVVIKIVKEA
jgi:hypothetical protein